MDVANIQKNICLVHQPVIDFVNSRQILIPCVEMGIKLILNSCQNYIYKMDEVEKYIKSLGEREKKAYKLAVRLLGSSFNAKKSIGYFQWIQKKTSQ